MNNHLFYNFDKLISYNALLNFIIGERGVGKTYGATKFVINDFLKHKQQFVYLRRYKSELRSSVSHFFEAIAKEFPDHEFKSQGDKFLIDGEVAGYAIALSTSNILKSTSFDNVKNIVFDEFIIDKGVYHYLRNEVTQFLDIIETIARLRDVRVFLLGNAITITNPYFLYFHLTLPYESEFKTFKDGTILVNYIKNMAYRKLKKNTRFGKLINGTSYGEYAIDNKFLRDDSNFIRRKSGNCVFLFTIVLDNKKYGVWNDPFGLVFSNDYDPNSSNTFSLSSDSHNEATVLLNNANPHYKLIKNQYMLGRLFFENINIKNQVLQVLQKSLY